MLMRQHVTLSEIYYPTCKIGVGFLDSVWQVKASFKKGTQPQVSNKTKSVHLSIKMAANKRIVWCEFLSQCWN